MGKAKNLKKRVSNYFNKSATHSPKTVKLISEISDIEFVIVNSEFDALLLENNLIKENQPRYNILLKDDKTFPFICVSNERFPRIYYTRRIIKSKGEYFGPYANLKSMKNIIELIRKLYTIRTCTLNLSDSNIKNGKFKVCLEYHIKNCKGPCEALQTLDDYNLDIEQAKNILRGKISVVYHHFKARMQYYSEVLDFEKAQLFKDKIISLENFQSKSLIVNPGISDIDVFTIHSEENTSIINYMRIVDGMVNLSETFETKSLLDETDKEILHYAIPIIRTKYNSRNKEIISNINIEGLSEDITTILPKIGDKKKLIELSQKNIWYYKKEKLSKKSDQVPNQAILEQLQTDLRLKELPIHIECFDNSNIQGTNPVASMVCFKNAKPAKREYRHYKIKTVTGPDDFGSMKEIVTRRYSRLLNEGLPMPNLIVIDGGKGQLNAACEALLSIDLYGKIPIIGIAKRLEEIYFPGDQYPIHISKKSYSLKVIQQLRDEAHRFAITFHRNLRSKSSLASELDTIEGIGSVSKKRLLDHFKTISNVKSASETDISKVIGKAKAAIVKKYWS